MRLLRIGYRDLAETPMGVISALLASLDETPLGPFEDV